MVRLLTILSCVVLTILPCHASNDGGYFDYRKTTTIALFTPHEEGAWFLSRPFAGGVPDTGKRFYQLVLPYLLQLEQRSPSLSDPLYYFDFHSDNSMRRFSVGEGWIATEDQVSFITNESDWNAIERIIKNRVEHTDPSENIGKSMLEERYLARVSSNGISKETEDRSLHETIDRIGPYVDHQQHH